MKRQAPVTLTAVMLAVVMVSAGGCPPPMGPHNVITKADRHRRDVMLADPVLRLAIAKPTVTVGEFVSSNQYQRGVVRAELLSDKTPQATPSEALTRIRTVLQTMRSSGWKAIYSVCVPPNVTSPVSGPIVSTGAGDWFWLLHLYRVESGVSYWARLSSIYRNGQRDDHGAFTGIEIVAPEEHDKSNMFADTPPDQPAGSTCPEQAAPPRTLQRAGNQIMVREVYFPRLHRLTYLDR